MPYDPWNRYVHGQFCYWKLQHKSCQIHLLTKHVHGQLTYLNQCNMFINKSLSVHLWTNTKVMFMTSSLIERYNMLMVSSWISYWTIQLVLLLSNMTFCYWTTRSAHDDQLCYWNEQHDLFMTSSNIKQHDLFMISSVIEQHKLIVIISFIDQHVLFMMIISIIEKHNLFMIKYVIEMNNMICSSPIPLLSNMTCSRSILLLNNMTCSWQVL